MKTQQLTMMALAIALNIVMGNLALLLRLPIYLDTMGTILSAALFGPVAGMVVGMASALITGVTVDLFSLYYSPVQLCIGMIAGWLLSQRSPNWSFPVKVLLIALSGTLISSLITAYFFGGITSSGSSLIVQLLHGLGLNQLTSIILVQIGTDYLDKFLSILVVVHTVKLLHRTHLYS